MNRTLISDWVTLINYNKIIGFGMGAFFDTVKMLMWAMLFMFLFVIPNMYIYSEGNGIKSDYMGMVTKYSLGNLGTPSFF